MSDNLVLTQVSTVSPQSVVGEFLGGYSNPGTRKAAIHSLKRILSVLQVANFGYTIESFPWHDLRREHTQAIRRLLIEAKHSSGTVNATLCCLRGVLKVAWRQKGMSSEEYAHAADVQAVKEDPGKPLAGRALTMEEREKLLGYFVQDVGLASRRDGALFAIGLGCGLRRAEMGKLDLADVEIRPDVPEPKLTVHGKGGKTRIAFVPPGRATILVHRWLTARGTTPGPLFLAISPYGRILFNRRLGCSSINYRMAYWADYLKIDGFTSHDLRRTFASELWDRGVDGSAIQQALGHASQDTSQQYDRRPDEKRREQLNAKLSGYL